MVKNKTRECLNLFREKQHKQKLKNKKLKPLLQVVKVKNPGLNQKEKPVLTMLYLLPQVNLRKFKQESWE